MVKYCLPIIKNSKEEVLRIISENPDYDFYEIWLSYIKDLDTDFVRTISDLYSGKLVFLLRRQNLEKSELTQDIKQKIIKLLETSDNFLDLDIKDQKKELDFIKENNLSNKIIISYHNYEETPELDRIANDVDSFRQLADHGNDREVIFKVSTFCKTPEDSIKLLTLLLQFKKQGKKFIILGMGEEGKIVRVISALWGNEMNFAPVSEGENSASGQLTKEKLEKIFKILK